MNKKDKRSLYRFLNRTYGDPQNMSRDMRRRLLIQIGGWVRQHQVPATRHNLRYELQISERPTNYTAPAKTLFERRSEGVHIATPRWHWNIYSRIMLPKTKSFIPQYVDPDMYADRSKGWDWVEKLGGKTVRVVIPVTYKLSIPEGIRIIGKRMVQRVWNHRVYSDKETWECSYWDFSCLNRDESSFNEITWSEGYVVLMATGAAVEKTLTRAISMARSRTVKSGVKSILSDHE